MNSDTDLLALYTNIKCLKISQKRKSVSDRPKSEIECCIAASCSSQISKLISSITEYDFKIWNNVRIIYQSITHGTLDPEWGGWCAEASDWSEMVTPASYWSVRWHSGTEPDTKSWSRNEQKLHCQNVRRSTSRKFRSFERASLLFRHRVGGEVRVSDWLWAEDGL